MKTIALLLFLNASIITVANLLGVLIGLLSLWGFGFMLVGIWCYFKSKPN